MMGDKENNHIPIDTNPCDELPEETTQDPSLLDTNIVIGDILSLPESFELQPFTKPVQLESYNFGYQKTPNIFNISSPVIYYKSSLEETSLERIERKLDELKKEVATREDIIKQTAELLDNQKKLNDELSKKIAILRELQKANLPHKRLAKYSIILLSFFIFSFLSRITVGVTIVTPLWNDIGLLLSFAFFIMALAMRRDWKENLEDN